MDIPMTISSTNELRPCYILEYVPLNDSREGEIINHPFYINLKEIKTKALFHMWLKQQNRDPHFNAPVLAETAVGLIEYENGKTELVKHDRILFADTNPAFHEYAWIDNRVIQKEENKNA